MSPIRILPNYTQIPNELLGEPYGRNKKPGMMASMSDAELRVFLAICRATLGYHQATGRVSIRTIALMTGLSKQGVLDGALAAEQDGLIMRHQDGDVTEWTV
jgi:phage replication O-like protein O